MSTSAKIAFGAIAFIAALIVASVVWFKTHVPIGLQPLSITKEGKRP